MTQDRMTLEPVRVAVTVPLAPEEAFRLFTEGIAGWWPTASHSVFEGDAASVTFESGVGGRIYEAHRDGREWEWGRVLAWDPPHRVVFSWQPSPSRSIETEVEVRFQELDEGTRVELEHRGWERLGDEASEVRGDYDEGWGVVLGAYQAAGG